MDLDTGEQAALASDLGVVDVYSAGGAVLEYGVLGGDRSFQAIHVGKTLNGDLELLRSGEFTSASNFGRISPTGDWLSIGLAKDNTYAAPDFFDTYTGERRTFGDPLQAIPLVWLDDVTVQVLAFFGDNERADLSLFRCTVVDGSCRHAVDLGPFPAEPIPVLPDGLMPW